MEGMISKEIIDIQEAYLACTQSTWTIEAWAKGLVVKLLEITHGQWLYRNVHVHDRVTGSRATARKEKLREEILDQIELGEDGLEEADRYLLDINLGDLDSTSGERQEIWLLAIQAAREARRLRLEEDTATSVAASTPRRRA